MPLTFLREKSSLSCRSGQLLTTSGSSISSQSTRRPDEGPSRTASRLQGEGGSAKGWCHPPAHPGRVQHPSSPAAIRTRLPPRQGLLLLQQQGAHHHNGLTGWKRGGSIRSGREECSQQLLQVGGPHLDQPPEDCARDKETCGSLPGRMGAAEWVWASQGGVWGEHVWDTRAEPSWGQSAAGAGEESAAGAGAHFAGCSSDRGPPKKEAPTHSQEAPP